MKKTIALGAISAMALTGFAYSEIDSSFNVGYNSTYVWRGLDLGDSMYQYGLDFGGSCDCGLDWSAGIWYANPSEGALNDELDIYAEVSKDFGSFSAALGFIHYEFDETAADNTELYASVGTSFSGFDLGVTYYHVVDGTTASTSWAEIGASYGFEVSDKLSGSLGFTFGTTIEDSGNDYSNYNLTLGLDYAASEDITISPYVAYNTTSDFAGGGDFEGVYGGVVLSYSF